MTAPLPLFDNSELARLVRECDRLCRKLKRGGMEARSRIRTEQKLALAKARQLQIEIRLGRGR